MSAENQYNAPLGEDQPAQEPKKAAGLDLGKIYKDLLRHKKLYLRSFPSPLSWPPSMACLCPIIIAVPSNFLPS